MDRSIEEARAKMIAARFGGNTKGANMGSGAARRKNKKPVNSVGDDKRLGSVLKKMSLQPLNGFEEVNIFKNDGEVIHITTPKIQASTPSNTYVVSGTVENKKLQELIPGVLNQLSPEMIRSYAESMKAGQPAAVQSQTIQEEEEEDEDDEVPDLVENFEEAAAK
jgi:nascent polypeptide-associated complex subunit beta